MIPLSVVKKSVIIHGHFYQPPRENPWLEVVEAQDSAAPYHDWNERVTAECYAPNSAARILDRGGTIARIVNNYRRISFNFGPTLLAWLEREAPVVYAALLRADRLSAKDHGHGGAMAQVYNHIIMPLANPRDKVTQVRWGIKDFARRFGRAPEGMWLAEAAVDLQSLAIMATEGIKFTVLSPYQAQAVRPAGGQWQDAGGGNLDTRRPYRVALPGGKSIAVFFYDGPLSRAVAFEHILDDGVAMARRIKSLFDPDPGEPQAVIMATDGESYGHHHRFGEMGLAYCLKALQEDPEVEVTNFAAHLAANPPTWEAKVVENSSWSCAHGVERWRGDCGCALAPDRGWSQAWRAPLRVGLDRLRDRLQALFERQGGELLKDPWAARDDYVELLGEPEPAAREAFLARHQARALSPLERARVFKLLESQHWGMYMFTSCGWFFDDISGIEPVQNLRFAARALQLAEELDGGGWEDDLLAELAKAQSNLPKEGNGALIWRREVAPSRVALERVVAHAVINGVMDGQPPAERVYCYRLLTEGYRHRHELGLHLAWGNLKVSHQRLEEPHELVYAALYAGGHEFRALVGPNGQGRALRDVEREVEQPLRLQEQQGLWEIFQRRLAGRSFGMADLFLEGRRALARDLLARTMTDYREAARGLYESHRQTMLFLREINVPLPPVFTALAEAILADDLTTLLGEMDQGPLPESLGELVMQARALGLNLDRHGLRRRVEGMLTADLSHLALDPDDAGCLVRAGQLLDLGQALGLELDLWASQNHFYRLLQDYAGRTLPEGVRALGRRLHFALD
ncbi:MAG: DUF3536 domain-containing protein [Thermodesulfobacteriota bacterium]